MNHMTMDHDFYSLFSAYWWLLVILGWGIAAMGKAYLRHRRAQQALELLASYAQQNKEPPPEVLALLQPQRDQHAQQALALLATYAQQNREPPPELLALLQSGNRKYRFWAGGLIFAAIAIAFTVLIFGRIAGPDHAANVAFAFVAVLMAGFSIGMFLMGILISRDKSRLPPP